MKSRKLRIVWSVLCGVAAALEAVGWVAYYPGNPHVFGEYWMPISLLAVLAIAPWVRVQFGLNTLLIATTLFAVVLGTIVHAIR